MILLISGDGKKVREEIEEFLSWHVAHEVMAIGRSVNLHEKVKHWANVDGADSKWWAEHLPTKNDGKFPIRHTSGECQGYDCDWEYEQDDYHYQEITGAPRTHGSTSLFAAKVGIALGYEKIVLAGCPLDSEGHWYYDEGAEPYGPIWLGFDFMVWLDFAQPERVRSMGGYTAKILGKATKEWCDEMR
jgi:hypothetical protein